MSEISSDPCEDLNELKNIEYPSRFRKAEDLQKGSNMSNPQNIEG